MIHLNLVGSSGIFSKHAFIVAAETPSFCFDPEVVIVESDVMNFSPTLFLPRFLNWKFPCTLDILGIDSVLQLLPSQWDPRDISTIGLGVIEILNGNKGLGLVPPRVDPVRNVFKSSGRCKIFLELPAEPTTTRRDSE